MINFISFMCLLLIAFAVFSFSEAHFFGKFDGECSETDVRTCGADLVTRIEGICGTGKFKKDECDVSSKCCTDDSTGCSDCYIKASCCPSLLD